MTNVCHPVYLRIKGPLYNFIEGEYHRQKEWFLTLLIGKLNPAAFIQGPPN